MKKWLNNIKSRMSALTSAKTDDAGWQETAAMVYVGDIYAVLLRDRAARRHGGTLESADHFGERSRLRRQGRREFFAFRLGARRRGHRLVEPPRHAFE